jgi:uncharacterized protein YukE
VKNSTLIMELELKIGGGLLSIIKMQTEQVRSLSEKLKSSSLQLDQNIESIFSAIRSASWQGQSKDEFVNYLMKVRKHINLLISNMEILGADLNREVDQWEGVDREFYTKTLVAKELISPEISGLLGLPAVGIGINRYLTGYLWSKDIDDIFNFYERNRKGKAFEGELIEANIHFEFTDEEGNVHYYGAEDGEVIPISWDESSQLPEGALGGYNNGPPPTITLNEKLKSGNAYDLRGTIAHEMQHALDYEAGRSNVQIKNKPFHELQNGKYHQKTQTELDNLDWRQLEESFENSCAERVKTEIAAHARGYEFNPLKETGEGVLNMDNVYSSEEFKVVLNDRDYADYYRHNIEEGFQSQGMNVDVDIYWDSFNESIQVEINNVEKVTEFYA